MCSYGVSWDTKPRFLMIVYPNPDQALSVDSSCKTKLNQDRIKTHIINWLITPQFWVKARQLNPTLSRTLESDQFPLFNDPNKACIYVNKIAKGHRLYANPFNHKNILDFSFRQKNVHFIKIMRYLIPISRYGIQSMRHKVTMGKVRYVKTKGSGYASQEKNIA